MFRNIAIALAATVCLATPIAAQTTTPVDPKFVQQLREALRQNPEIIFEAAAIGQEKQRQAQVAQQNSKVDAARPELFAKTAFGPVVGNPNGSKTVVELMDYACGFCKRSNPLVEEVVAADNDVRFVMVMRPVLGPGSETLARFALAADMQGKFKETHHALYEKFGDGHRTPANDENLKEVAAKAGLDFDRAKRDMVSDAVVAKLAKHNEVADKMAVTGTPFFAGAKSVIPGAPQTADQLKGLAAK